MKLVAYLGEEEKKKKTKKSKPSIEEIIFELEKSNNPIDKKIAKELNLTLHGWR